MATITVKDVLLGRGKRIHAWEGNVQFRKLIAEHCVLYHLSNDTTRREVIARGVLEMINNEGGRFLRLSARVPDTATTIERLLSTSWTEICRQDALKKIKQALRDSGAKTIASDKCVAVGKKHNKKTSPADLEPIHFEVGGASAVAAHLRPGDTGRTESFRNQQLPVAFASSTTPSTPVLAFDLNVKPGEGIRASDNNHCPVALRRSYTLGGMTGRHSLYPQISLLEAGGGLGPSPKVCDVVGSLHPGMGPIRVLSGEREQIIPQGLQQPYPNAKLPATSTSSPTCQQLKLTQPKDGILISQGFTSAEMQIIDHALSLGEESSADTVSSESSVKVNEVHNKVLDKTADSS